jgi:hypothetical protein
MNIKRLKELKDKLKHESDLSKIWLFYMDHFADHEAFMELGQPAENDSTCKFSIDGLKYWN